MTEELAKNRDLEGELLQEIESFVYDPLGFVMFVYPWGEGPLKDEDGPDEWQQDILNKIGEKTRQQAAGELLNVIQIAIKAGRDPGKTALIAWIIHWFMSTRPHPQGVVTANTKTQLETKTWREVAKWHKMSVHEHWFDCTATKFSFKAHEKTWFTAAIPWSKDRPQAFAGTHEKYVLMVFDESSTIADIIWETAEGGLTDPYCLWIVVGNPTENTGRFKECFPPGGKFKGRWDSNTIDSRTAKRPNKHKIQEWIEDYGEDSDFVRVWVKGEFPRTAVSQFIGETLVDEAMQRRFGLKTDIYDWASVVIGVDVARYGDDRSVILVRQGRMVHEINTYREIDTMTLAAHTAEKIKEWKAQTVFISATPDSWGVTDRLRQLGFQSIIEVTGGGTATKEDEYFNKRAEMWADAKAWLAGGSLPDDPELKADLIGPTYGFDGRSRMQLEVKKDMKTRLGFSPDKGDAFSYTFAMPVVRDEKSKPKTLAEKDYEEYTQKSYDKYEGSENIFELEEDEY
jgi:hypothetical protein